MRMSSALTTGTPIPSSASRSTRESDTHIKVLPRVHDKVAARASAEDIAAKGIGGNRVYESKENLKAEEEVCERGTTKGSYLYARRNKRDLRAHAIYTASKTENA